MASFLSTETHQHFSSPASNPAGHYLCPWVIAEKATHCYPAVCAGGGGGPGCPEIEPDPGFGSIARASDIRARGGLSAFTPSAGVRRCARLAGLGSSCGAGVVPRRHLCPILITVVVALETQVRESGGSFQTGLWVRAVLWAGEDVGSEPPTRVQTPSATSWLNLGQGASLPGPRFSHP